MSSVVKPLPFPIGKVARIDLEIPDASFSRDRHSVTFPDDHATSACLSSAVIKRKRIPTAFELADIRGI